MSLRASPNHTDGRSWIFATRWYSGTTSAAARQPAPRSALGLYRITLYTLDWERFSYAAAGVVDDFGNLVPVEVVQ